MSTTINTTTEPIAAGTWKLDPVHSHVGFAVKHMVVSTFKGGFEDYEAKLTSGPEGAPRIEGAVKVDSIAVKDENLAAHLKAPDFFDTANYPEIGFASTDIRLDGERLEVAGELTIKGHTHPVTAQGRIAGPHVDIAGKDKLGIDLEAVIDRREYGLEWNAPLPKGGFALDNDVRLEVSLELVREA
jgi:polyisoprenoid-binding protein YceI